MPLTLSKFSLDEELSLVGNLMRVSGILQLEDPAGRIATRYLLTGGAGAAQILQEQGDDFTLLRPFPPASQPQVADNAVNVMGEKYTLAGVSKLKVLGKAGNAPADAAESAVVLSGKFDGPMGTLVREIVPGAAAQNFYAVKPLPATDVLTAQQVAAIHAAEAQVREQQAQASAETEEEEGAGKKILRFVIVILVVAALVYACSGPDGDDSGSGSARTVSGGFHGK